MNNTVRLLVAAMALVLILKVTTPSYGDVIIPGLVSSTLDDKLKGRVLIEELNCVACHASERSLAERSKKSPRLSEVGSRLNPNYIEAFLRDPQRTKPGTTMPDALAQLSGEEKKRAAISLTHFLLSLNKNGFSPQAPDAVAARQGERLFRASGCVACHSPRDAKGTETLPATSAPLGALDKKYCFKSLVEFLRQPLASRPSGRMPDMRLQGEDVERIAHYLLRDTQVPGSLNYTLYRGDVWEGLASENVKAERAGLVKDFALESLGGVQHLSTELLEREAGIELMHVPYKGTGPGLVDLLAGQVQVTLTSVPSVLPHAKAGKLRALLRRGGTGGRASCGRSPVCVGSVSAG